MVLVILGMLTAVAAPRLYRQMSQGKSNIAKIHIGQIETALQIFAFDMGRFPTTAEGLQALAENPAGSASWNGPYLEKGVQPDPWNNPYIYRNPGRTGEFDICSMGPDGVEGTDDDICN
jgi:general secretion pathway protein G